MQEKHDLRKQTKPYYTKWRRDQLGPLILWFFLNNFLSPCALGLEFVGFYFAFICLTRFL